MSHTARVKRVSESNESASHTRTASERRTHVRLPRHVTRRLSADYTETGAPRENQADRATEDEKQLAVKLIRSWGLKFSGEEKQDDPEEFWDRLEECREGSSVSDRGIIQALPCISSKRASRWYRTVKQKLSG